MLVAARKDIVEEYVSLVEMAGLNPGVMDVDAFALQNALEISDAETRGCYALVNVGAEELGINAIKDGISLFTRDSSYGGSQVNRAIMRSLKVGFEQAEKIKLGGVRLEGSEQSLKKIVADAVSEWVNEIKRALDFVAGTHPGEAIETVFLSGGASRTPGFKERLAEETRIPVKRFNPFANLTVSEKVFDLDYLKFMAPQAAVAVGLALRSIADK
jgi:type IV pilus assembly protein PilM